MMGFLALATFYFMLACYITYTLLTLTSDHFLVVLPIISDLSATLSSLAMQLGWIYKCLVGVDEQSRTSS